MKKAFPENKLEVVKYRGRIAAVVLGLTRGKVGKYINRNLFVLVAGRRLGAHGVHEDLKEYPTATLLAVANKLSLHSLARKLHERGNNDGLVEISAADIAKLLISQPRGKSIKGSFMKPIPKNSPVSAAHVRPGSKQPRGK